MFWKRVSIYYAAEFICGELKDISLLRFKNRKEMLNFPRNFSRTLI